MNALLPVLGVSNSIEALFTTPPKIRALES
jgi:hypothetical protein